MHAVLLQWMRTGERKYLRALDASIYHTLDVDTVHHNPNDSGQVGGVRTHNDNHCGGSSLYGGKQVVSPSHMWAEGLAEYYCLFGDNRALEGARGICDVIVAMQDSGKYDWNGERTTGWACISLIPTYEACNDSRYLRVAGEMIHHVLPKQAEDGSWYLPFYGFRNVRCPFQSTIFAAGMMYYLRAADDEPVKRALLKFCDWRVRDGIMPDGSVYYYEHWDYHRSRYGGDLREPLGFAYALTGDLKYIEHGMADHERCFAGSLQDLVSGWAWEFNPQTKRIVKVFGHVIAMNWRGNLRFMYWAHKAGKLRDLPVA